MHGLIQGQPTTASRKPQLSWSLQSPVLGILALSELMFAGQTGTRTRADQGPDREGRKAENKDKPREKRRDLALGVGLSIPRTGRAGTEKVWVRRRCPVDAGDMLGLRLPWRVAGRQRLTASGSHVARAEGSMAGMHHKPASIPWDSQWGISSPEVITTRRAWTLPWKKGPAGAPGASGKDELIAACRLFLSFPDISDFWMSGASDRQEQRARWDWDTDPR